MENPTVVVIIPARDEGPWLANTIASLREHAGYENYSVVVIDDASVDGCCQNVDANVIVNDKMCGPGQCRNRGMRETTSDLIVTIDAHQCFSKDWLARLVESHLLNPNAFIIGASTGMRDVEDVEAIDATNENEIVDNATIVENYERPFIVELSPRYRKTKDNPEGLFVDNRAAMNALGVPIIWGPKDLEGATLRIKGTRVVGNRADYYGADLSHDPEDRNFITPKWNPCFSRGRKPIRNPVRCDAMMGACYLFPRKLFEERIGGWPQINGWVHEEPYLSIAAYLQGIPVLLRADVIAAHNYDRPRTADPNEANMHLNQQYVTMICFDDMAGLIWKQLWGEEEVPGRLDWVDEYREKVQAGRVMTDYEFLCEAGLHWYFVPKYRERILQRLGGNAPDLSKAGKKDIEKAIDGLIQNSDVDWHFSMTSFSQGNVEKRSPEAHDNVGTVIRASCANEWDAANKCRSAHCNRNKIAEMMGWVGNELLRQQLAMSDPRVIGAHLRALTGGGNGSTACDKGRIRQDENGLPGRNIIPIRQN